MFALTSHVSRLQRLTDVLMRRDPPAHGRRQERALGASGRYIAMRQLAPSVLMVLLLGCSSEPAPGAAGAGGSSWGGAPSLGGSATSSAGSATTAGGGATSAGGATNSGGSATSSGGSPAGSGAGG